MRYIIWTIRSAFCKHDWDYDEQFSKVCDVYDNTTKQGVRVSATCKKCGWHRNYWKHH